METFPAHWSELLEEMLPRNECDICSPPLDIGPPPPLPANFQDKAILSGSCNVCSLLSDVDMRPMRKYIIFNNFILIKSINFS